MATVETLIHGNAGIAQQKQRPDSFIGMPPYLGMGLQRYYSTIRIDGREILDSLWFCRPLFASEYNFRAANLEEFRSYDVIILALI